MKSIIKEVAHPIAASPFRAYLRTLTGVFTVKLKTVIRDYLQSALILLAGMVIVFFGIIFVTHADFLKDDGWMGSAKVAAGTAPKTLAAVTPPAKTLTSSGTGSAATYTYDNEGARATKTENGKTTYYVNKYYEEDSDGTIRKFIWAGDVKVATVESVKGSSAPEKVTYHHSDHLGGSNVSTDSAGSVAEVNDYFPYGKSRIEERTGTYTNNYLFTGKELDRSSGLYYYGARYYDPLIGRFTGIDPVLTIGGWKSGKGITDILQNPQMMNGYSYTANNPLKYTDPTGEYLIPAVIDPSAGLAGTAWGQNYNPKPMSTGEKITVGALGTLATGGMTAVNEVSAIVNHIRNIIGAVTSIKKIGDEKTIKLLPAPKQPGVGEKVWRIFGGKSQSQSKYWTPNDPKNLANPRNDLGLPKTNTGEYVNEGIIKNTDGIKVRPAKPLDGTKGGATEYKLSNPDQVDITKTTKTNKPY